MRALVAKYDVDMFYGASVARRYVDIPEGAPSTALDKAESIRSKTFRFYLDIVTIIATRGRFVERNAILSKIHN